MLDHWLNGSIQLCHEGCGHNVLLVVSGPERGTVWGDSRVSDGGIYPLILGNNPPPLYRMGLSSERITFLQWYEHWLDHWQTLIIRPRPQSEVREFWHNYLKNLSSG